jgi:hypothetical protein
MICFSINETPTDYTAIARLHSRHSAIWPKKDEANLTTCEIPVEYLIWQIVTAMRKIRISAPSLTVSVASEGMIFLLDGK